MCFPSGFFFGTATAAQQVEGGFNATGRTPSFWDTICRYGSSIKCSNVADDFVHRYASDVQLMKSDGHGAFRMSLSWSRVMNWNDTTGRMEANPEGVAFYHSLLDELEVNGIEPVVTIFHWDTPFELYSLGDFLNTSMIDHFVDYTDLVLKEYGQKVKHWATINEPLSYMTVLYIGQGTDADEYEAAHNMILAHASAVQHFRELKTAGTVLSDAEIGIVLSGFGVTLNESDPADNEAAERYAQFNVGWWLSPLTTGDYPAVMRERVGDRLPTFTTEEAALVKGSYDLFMYNFYYADQITDCASTSSNTSCSSLKGGWAADMGVDDSHMPADAVYSDGSGYCAGHFGYPPSYLEAIEWVHNHDTSANIMLTENGWCGNQTIDNQDQLWYFRTHLQQVHKAIYEKNIPIVGYLAWSFMDNYEWGSYAARYGLYHVDYPDNIGDADLYSVPDSYLTRTPRSAAKFFSSVATTGCLEVESDDLKWL